jgi:trk system potassium uptake protein TrkH
MILRKKRKTPMVLLWRFSAFNLLAFFFTVILAGALALKFSGSWPGRLNFTDAVFTAASAVCVAGLSSVDVSQFSHLGGVIILCLIQIGGLGIVSFSCITFIMPGIRLGLMGSGAIKSLFLEGIEYRPKSIIRIIIIFTFLIEAAGALCLSILFYQRNIENWLFMAIFHSVSAFCNTGLSLFPTQLRAFSGDIPVLIVLSFLVISGSLGFLVIHDIFRLIRNKTRRLSYHSRIVLFMTLAILLIGTALFFSLERSRAYSSMTTPSAFANALFQTINARSSGFDVTVQSGLSQPSKLLTSLVMIIGGAPGSIAGGINITTLFIALVFLLKRPDKYGDINIFHHRLRATTVSTAVAHVLKALFLLLICISALSLVEGLHGAPLTALIFDGISAFGTVGLSLGITPLLSAAGKWIIIATMFAGRVGLYALSFHAIKTQQRNAVSYPEGSLLLK